jgi:hypothetical protein
LNLRFAGSGGSGGSSGGSDGRRLSLFSLPMGPGGLGGSFILPFSRDLMKRNNKGSRFVSHWNRSRRFLMVRRAAWMQPRGRDDT